jgi:hypothetical protein
MRNAEFIKSGLEENNKIYFFIFTQIPGYLDDCGLHLSFRHHPDPHCIARAQNKAQSLD